MCMYLCSSIGTLCEISNFGRKYKAKRYKPSIALLSLNLTVQYKTSHLMTLCDAVHSVEVYKYSELYCINAL